MASADSGKKPALPLVQRSVHWVIYWDIFRVIYTAIFRPILPGCLRFRHDGTAKRAKLGS
ncbi:hypothetical protein V474_22210 [Novosphingobium barchaimii LL02]|uniref:Uncharacterized protein n=1 Tax=Novosphingobium barchaimii LL02 TaxID=1114963 RepID=A0A0J7XNT1_9SPHN|nr:hypothetical protein V474_22210 [Novosphingobium barchaimii LL02]